MAVPFVLDTDPGVDDAVAFMVALGSPEIDLVAVTTTWGNVAGGITHANAHRLLALAGRADVPVGRGADRALVHDVELTARRVHGDDGLGGRADLLPPHTGGPGPSAVALLAHVLRTAAEPVTIGAIGPLTNIAVLLAAHPDLTGAIGRIVIMGGGMRGGNVTAAAEFNVHADPEAAQRVLTQADVPVTLVPLDVTLACPFLPEHLARLAAGGPRCAVLAQVIEHYRGTYRHLYGEDAVAVHDAVAVLEAAVPGSLLTEDLPLQVVCDQGPARGLVLPDRRRAPHGPRVAVATAPAAGPGPLVDEILDRVTRLG